MLASPEHPNPNLPRKPNVPGRVVVPEKGKRDGGIERRRPTPEITGGQVRRKPESGQRVLTTN